MSRSYMFDDRTQENRRKQREEAQVELRQLKKEELLNKKRSLSLAVSQISNFQEMRERLYSDKLDDVYQGTYEFRSLLSVEGSPPVQAVIDSGCLPRFVEILDKKYLHGLLTPAVSEDIIDKIRIESAWVMTNIAAGTSEQTNAVLQAGALAPLLAMLQETNELVVDQSVWALGNIAGDCEASRDCIINAGGLQVVVGLLDKLIDNDKYLKLVRNLTWMLSNLNRGRSPAPTVENMQLSMYALFKLVSLKDPETVCDAFWALSYIVDIDNGCTDVILGSHVMSKAYNCLDAYTRKLKNMHYDADDAKIGFITVSPIIRMIGNIATGNDNQTLAILRMGFLQFFGVLFYRVDANKCQRLRKEICWTVSNLTAGPLEQVETIISTDVLSMLVDAIGNYEPYIRKEACWALSNALFHCANKHEWTKLFVDNGIVEGLKSYLELAANLVDMQAHILDCFMYLLEGGRKYEKKYGKNVSLEKIIDCDVVSCIENLQDVENVEVADKAYRIIVEFFEGIDS